MESDQHVRELYVLADIRAAIGDTTGKLMQDELVERVKRMQAIVEAAYAVAPILIALQHTVGLGKHQMKRVMELDKALHDAKEHPDGK